MIRKAAFLLSALLIVGQSEGAYASASDAAHRVNVSIIRQESLVRSSTGNRGAYVVHVTTRTGSDFIARIVDRYPADDEAVPLSNISAGGIVSVVLKPTHYCDDSTGAGRLQRARCFAVIHDSWRIPKEQTTDEWWK
jgi:hypothetical protein